MPLPSLYRFGEQTHAWSVTRAAAYGAVVGALAALFKTFAPVHTAGTGHLAGHLLEIAAAAAVFALLCAAAAMARNFLARRLV
jgi:cytochrome c oxidase assembly factor CtaG